jgi:hypothetical protein
MILARMRVISPHAFSSSRRGAVAKHNNQSRKMESVNVPVVMGTVTAIVDVSDVMSAIAKYEIEVTMSNGCVRKFVGSGAEVFTAHEKLTAAMMRMYPEPATKVKGASKPRKRSSAPKLENGDSPETVAHAPSAPEMKGIPAPAPAPAPVPAPLPAVKRSKKEREKLRAQKAGPPLHVSEAETEPEAEAEAEAVESKVENDDEEE